MILYHAADLIWAMKIRGTAEAIGVPARPVRSLEILRERLADSPVRALIVDLEAPDMALELLRAVQGPAKSAADKTIRTLAFGPHVAVDRFEMARAAGVDIVFPRGAFAARISTILRSLDSGEPIGPASGD